MENKIKQLRDDALKAIMGTTTISFHVSDPAPVKLEVYDSRGEKIGTLVDDNLMPGDYNKEWDVSRIQHPASGIYLLKLTTGSGIITRKILLLN